MVRKKFPYKTIYVACLFFAATELLADADVSEGATKKKQTRGKVKMNALVIHNSCMGY